MSQTGEPENKRPKLVDDRHIVLFKGCFDDPVGIVLPETDNLSLSELERAVPGANGIRYLNTNTGHYLSLKFDEQTQSFPPPLNGWSKDIIYQVVNKDPRSGPYLRVQSPLPELEEPETFCFYASNFDQENEVRSPVTCIHPFYFTTYFHTTRVEYKKDVTQVKVYAQDGTEYNTVVKHISIEQDFVILKSEKKICDRGPHICKTQCSGLILLCGCYTNEFDKLEQCKKEGCLQSPETIVLRSSGGKRLGRGPFLIGVVTTAPGDSGCAVFCPHGLKGMNVATQDFPKYAPKHAVKEAAKHLSKCMIVPATDIMKEIRVYYF
uniref:TAR DNA-binding protein 43 N-terminal domain-containing protein n=1 Tax=Meloidogyne enterolobii TaxID=390850 RepID=A0A6V7UAB1_MELEN|nr:unnamed protein product [Meloidogyne enterolobii]